MIHLTRVTPRLSNTVIRSTSYSLSKESSLPPKKNPAIFSLAIENFLSCFPTVCLYVSSDCAHALYRLKLRILLVQVMQCSSLMESCNRSQQDVQRSQRDRAARRVIVLAKSERLEVEDNILRTL